MVPATSARPPASGHGPNANGPNANGPNANGPNANGPNAISTAAATLIGKRYTDAAETVELLCTSSGAGVLSCDGAPMTVKAAKPLPASD
jgi:hypothetical protein